MPMNLIARATLHGFGRKHPDAKPALDNLEAIFKLATWCSMDDIVKSCPGRPSPVSADRVVINVLHNKYRLICAVKFGSSTTKGIIFVKWFGSHAEYDKVDAATVGYR